jgi:carbon monoxide dehydrogenase subunit G
MHYVRDILLGWLMAVSIWLCPLQAAAQERLLVSASDVRVERSGDHFTVDLSLYVPVPPALAWGVLTDFDRMAGFVPNLVSSDVMERHESVLKIRQKGVSRFGIFSTNFESIQETQLTEQREIRAHGISGDFKRMDSVMQLAPEGNGTRLTYHADVQPDFWFPPFIGPVMARRDVAEQFSAMLSEMLRRQ